jgi:phosphate-selective porin OprO and OprP
MTFTSGSPFKRRLLATSGLTVFAVALLSMTTRPAHADDAQIQKLEQEIQRIEAAHQSEIRSLRAEIKQLRHDQVTIRSTRVPRAPVQAANAPIVTESASHHFGLSSADGLNTIELTGRLHLDGGNYFHYAPGPTTTDQAGLATNVNLRRARIGVVGKWEGDWSYALIYDFGGNTDTLNPSLLLANANTTKISNTSYSGISGVENAFITYNGLYNHGQKFPVAFDLGFMDVPWTLDEATSSNDIMFMERSSSQVIATEFGGGDFRSAFGIRSNNDRYWIGGYLTGPTAGSLSTDGAACVAAVAGSPCIPAASVSGYGPSASGLVRASYQLVQTKDATVHLGFNYGNMFAPRVGANDAGIQLYDRPELRVDPTYFLNTSAVPARDAQVFGAEAAASYGNAFIQGEYYHYIIDTTKGTTSVGVSTITGGGGLLGGTPGPAADFNGGYVEASYTFGGKREYRPASGAYTGVIPEKPLVWGGDGFGAVELAGRFSIVNLNSGGLQELVKAGTGYTSYTGGEQTSYGAGINWYPNTNMRLMLDYEHVIVSNPAVFSGPSLSGATIDWIASRVQFAF